MVQPYRVTGAWLSYASYAYDRDITPVVVCQEERSRPDRPLWRLRLDASKSEAHSETERNGS